MITCFSPDGKIQWQHKMTGEPNWRMGPIATKEGNILIPDISEKKVSIISTDARKYEEMKSEKIRAVIDKASKEMKKEEPGETKNIRIDAEKKVIDIGGVRVPIKQKQEGG